MTAHLIDRDSWRACRAWRPTRKRAAKLIWLAGLLVLLVSPLQAQERKDVTITELLSITVTSNGQPIVLPKDAQIVVSIYDVLPGTALQVHQSSFPRYAYVLSGHVRVTNVDTGQSDTYKPGDFIVESVGQWHMGSNVGAEPLKLLVIGFVEKGQSNTQLAR